MFKIEKGKNTKKPLHPIHPLFNYKMKLESKKKNLFLPS